MLIQEPVQVAIWTNLNFYAFEDAIFLAERLLAEVETDESLYLLATCYYRSGRTNEAYWLLSTRGASTQKSKFLLAKCAYELKHYTEAENILCNNRTPKTQKDLEAICKEYGLELSGFVMQLMSKICQKTERTSLANDCSRESLKINPFLWQSFSDLCNRGERPNVKEIFQIRSDELFVQLEKQLLYVSNACQDRNTIINEKNSSISGMQFNCITPNNIMTTNHHFNVNTADDTPLIENQNQSAVGMQYIDVETPYRKQFKYLNSNLSPVTPSFGVLPLNSPLNDNLKQNRLFITPSPPLQQNQQSQLLDSDKNISNKKIRGNLNSLVNRKEISTTPLQQTQHSKPVVLNQSINIASPNRTPQEQRNQSVRRSSRIFSNYSVKENNKSPKFAKFVQPRSPPRKTSKRVSKSTKSTLNELNEKNTILNEKEKEKEKIETITSAQMKATDVSSHNINNISSMKRQSADGLMILLQSLGEAYLHLQQYELDEALEVLETKVPYHHFNSSWVQSIIALIYHEKHEYEHAVKIFSNIRKAEPYRLQYMEIYSTDLWHLQKETLLSILAQDLMKHSKNSAITWCVAGNCFSALKEHDTAIKFFNRAIQLDPDFSYSYTLLGHELVVTEELEKALGCFRKAILKNSRHYNAWYGIGSIFSKQERFQLAEIHYRHALKINQKSSVLLVHIGVMQFYLNKREQAIQTLLDAIKLDPKNPLCKFNYASMNLKMGKLQEALDELEELKQIVPKESIIFYLIGKIHKQLGNIDLALMHFSWATDLDPKGANNQIKDKFDSVIRSHQQQPEQQSEGGEMRSREEFDEDDDVSLDEDEIDATASNDNNNSSGGLEESEISMNQDH